MDTKETVQVRLRRKTWKKIKVIAVKEEKTAMDVVDELVN